MLPMEISHKIDEIMARFVWLGIELKRKIPLVRWKSIARLIAVGGWRILNTHNFNGALIINFLLRATNDNVIWGQVIREKYMKGQTLSIWSRMGTIRSSEASYIWRSVLRNFHWMLGFM